MQPKIVITGGSGFLGRNICRLANSKNIPVVSISRSGKPEGAADDAYPSVNWVVADVFSPDSWKEHLQDCTAVIHSIGIIEEVPEKGITYDKMIYESAKIVAAQAVEAGVKRFVFISAAGGGPDTPAGYMNAKEKTEEHLASLGLSLVILKPGMIYGAESPGTTEEAQALFQLIEKDPHAASELRPKRPLPVVTVAKVALQAAQDEQISGKLSVDEIEELAGKAA